MPTGRSSSTAASPDLEAARAHLAHVDGIMLGRAAYQNPELLIGVDPELFGEPSPVADGFEAIEAFMAVIARGLRARRAPARLHPPPARPVRRPARRAGLSAGSRDRSREARRRARRVARRRLARGARTAPRRGGIEARWRSLAVTSPPGQAGRVRPCSSSAARESSCRAGSRPARRGAPPSRARCA